MVSLEIKLNAFGRSTIPQNQFIIILHHIIQNSIKKKRAKEHAFCLTNSQFRDLIGPGKYSNLQDL